MRVIAGKARRLLLKTIEGADTRPTTDRIKETLFNILNLDLADCCFLDLFAGSGAIGIEALSRGAKKAVFIEQNQKAADCIRTNLETTHLYEAAMVLNCDVLTGLRRLEDKTDVFDFVFMDPPYNMGLERRALEQLLHSSLVDADTTFIIEAELDTDFSYLEDLGYDLDREKRYKTNKHVFIKKGDGL